MSTVAAPLEIICITTSTAAKYRAPGEKHVVIAHTDQGVYRWKPSCWLTSGLAKTASATLNNHLLSGKALDLHTDRWIKIDV